MSINVDITVDYQEVSTKIESLKQAVSDFANSQPKKIADDMVTQMQQQAPVLTGYLRDHITAEDNGDNSATVASEADYSIYVEFGTRYMSAEPFFFNVVDSFSTQSIADALKSALEI